MNSMAHALLPGLMAALPVESLTQTLIFTRQSSTPALAYRRFKANVINAQLLYEYSLEPGTQAWKSIDTVRKLHVVINKRLTKAGAGILSQKDMAITQFLFMGFSLLMPDEFGIVGCYEQIDVFNHLCRLFGYLLGTHDRFNCCGETLEETQSRLKSIVEDMISPPWVDSFPGCLAFNKTTFNGLWHSDPTIHYGGGLPIGSILLIEEDEFCTYSTNLTKYFLTEGIVSDQPLYVVNLEEDHSDFLRKLPKVCKVEGEQTTELLTNSLSDLRIAWRYNSLPSIDYDNKSATYFDSSRRIDPTMLAKADIESFKVDDDTLHNGTQTAFQNPIYNEILESLKNKLNESRFLKVETLTQSECEKNILRVSISSLGSPLWYEYGFYDDICLFLYSLRSFIRNSYVVGCITMPTHLFKHLDTSLISRIRNLVDYSIELESFTGSNKETNPIFKDYHGLLHIRKLSAFNSLSAYTPDTHDLAFKLKRKNLCIEKLHLPPELHEPESSTDTLPSLSCGSSSKNRLEF